MYGIEIIGSIFLCVLLSGLAFLLARRSLIETDIIEPKEEIKQKIKSAKKVPKVKVAIKETGRTKEAKKENEEVKVDESIKVKTNSKKNKPAKIEITIKSSPVISEKVASESPAEWKQVIKSVKKVSKKESKVDIVVENEVVDNEAKHIENVQEIPIIVQKSSAILENKSNTSKAKKKEISKMVKQTSQPANDIKLEEKPTEIKIKQSKENVVDESKYQSEDIDLRRRVGELMSELDKQKNVNKDENKSNLLTINQLNKELDGLKQKIKISQLSEEKLNEELKKKTTAQSEFKLQYGIVQSELTKNIVHVQSLGREKDKLETRLKVLESSNMQLREKADLFEEVNSEKEKFSKKLVTMEEELATTKQRYTELFQTKEKESNEKINQLQQEKQKMQEQLVRVQTDLIDNNTKLQNMQQELLNTKNTYTDLLNENMRLQKNCADLESATLSIKQQQSFEATVRDYDHDKVAQALKKCEQLQATNDKLVEEKETMMKQYQKNAFDQTERSKLIEEIAKLSGQINVSKQFQSQTRDNVDNYKEGCDKLVKEIEEIKRENDDLVNVIEQYKLKSESAELELVKLQTLVTEKEENWKKSLVTLQNESDEKVKTLSLELNKTKNMIEKSSNEDACTAYIKEINDLKNEKSKLTDLVDQYKIGLENTESILSKLQISVTEEENKWRESLLKSESEAEKCTKELEKVYNELMRISYLRADKNELNFAYHCVDKSLSSLIDEMEARMNHFETSLEAVIQERDNALAQIHVQMNGTTSEDNSAPHFNNINNEDNDREITKIKEDLSHQIEVNKSLETHCNKYKSLIEIGKDALEAEKVQVKALKEELKLLQTKLSVDINHEL